MNLLTLLGFLVGRRDCIEAFARSPHTLWIGAMFVLSAGFAREYDAEDLLREPWHLLVPFAASLLTASMLYGMAKIPTLLVGGLRQARAEFRTLLGVFWLTAPLAWFYAIPYERWMEPMDAFRTNMFTLFIVAMWRVALMIRILTVVAGMRFHTSLGVTMTVSCLLVIGAAALLIVHGIDLGELMGGARREAESTLDVIGIPVLHLAFGAFYSLPVWFLLALLFCAPERWLVAEADAPPPSVSLRWFVFASLAVWVFLLPGPQAEQQRRSAVITGIRQERFADAAELLRRWPREAFPPVWTLWPHAAPYGDRAAAILPVTGMLREELPEWARRRYEQRLSWVLFFSPTQSPQNERIAWELEQVHALTDIDPELKKDVNQFIHRLRDLGKQP